jgi:hypothetical protein
MMRFTVHFIASLVPGIQLELNANRGDNVDNAAAEPNVANPIVDAVNDVVPLQEADIVGAVENNHIAGIDVNVADDASLTGPAIAEDHSRTDQKDDSDKIVDSIDMGRLLADVPIGADHGVGTSTESPHIRERIHRQSSNEVDNDDE